MKKKFFVALKTELFMFAMSNLANDSLIDGVEFPDWQAEQKGIIHKKEARQWKCRELYR